MSQFNPNQTDTFQQLFRATVFAIGIIMFIVVAAAGVGQADDSKYIEGRPSLWAGTSSSTYDGTIKSVDTIEQKTVQVPADSTTTTTSTTSTTPTTTQSSKSTNQSAKPVKSLPTQASAQAEQARSSIGKPEKS